MPSLMVHSKPSTCSNHKAVDAERSTKGLAATGVGTIDCARHDIKRPSSVGDLQKGEQYVNMDYLFFSSIKDTELVEVVVSYDIVCQWSIKVWDRMRQYLHHMHVDHEGGRNFVFLIPKFHLPAHIMACQTVFSFNYNTGVGRTDGEAPERGWSHINPVATSTREMGPGSRQDTLDDHFGDWNWKKTTLMAISLLRKIKNAVSDRSDQVFRYHQFELGIPKHHVDRWKEELKLWEDDHRNPNPFETRYKSLTLDAVRRALAQQDAVEMANGDAYVLHEEVSASQLIITGLDLEEQQYVRRNVLKRKIERWIDIQHLYVPILRRIRSDREKESDDQAEIKAEQIELLLPSGMPPRRDCDYRLRELEWQLRSSQANDALDELRNGLRLQAYLYIDKDRFQRGQHQNTRSRGIIQRVKDKINAAAIKYRVARGALRTLAAPLTKVGWEKPYPVLADADVKQLSGNGDESEGHRELSWIWTRLGDGSQIDAEVGLQDALCIEWCKSKARADRWSEEVQLLLEEMRRIAQFFESRAEQWDRRAQVVTAADEGIERGLHAYATQQAWQFRAMKARCQHVWRFVPQYVQIGLGIDVVPPELDTELDTIGEDPELT
ncbi:hypothetical protein Hypma_000426 [Hypsizygus marmoreus]|uniref:CxC2-like cysteine cluster KDZ transposase-associated domain-containing protein n=1 Tax=Hypsizygus marmoreus TaxID=39966 RepID=A0A369JF64_HYPMA|nr:hypothetical protein Hypma_000426 [Hypsizygus marmoreus]